MIVSLLTLGLFSLMRNNSLFYKFPENYAVTKDLPQWEN